MQMDCPLLWEQSGLVEIIVPSINTKPVLYQKPPHPSTGRSNINILHGCSPTFTLCPLSRCFPILWGYIATRTDGEISTSANAATSTNLGGEGIDSCAAWTFLSPVQEVILKKAMVFRFPFHWHLAALGIYRDAKLLHALSVGFPLLLCIFYPKTISCFLVDLSLKVNWAPEAETWVVWRREDEEQYWKGSEIFPCRVNPGLKDSLFPEWQPLCKNVFALVFFLKMSWNWTTSHLL